MSNNYKHILNINNMSSDTWNEEGIDNKMSSCTTKESKLNAIVNILRDNFYGCDILLCLFMAALQSYRVDRCLRPFPTMYIKESNKDIDNLRRTCETIPTLDNILKSPQMCSNEVIELLLWLFCQKEQPQLKKISYNEVNVPSEIRKSFQPHYTFEVIYPERAETTWHKRKGSRSSFLGYHGSQLDNFYSILKVGLQQHFGIAKELLYGKGIYLTSEITVSMTYAPFSLSWVHSTLGGRKSIIAVCEVIDDIDKVKCKDAKFKERAVNQGSISGSIPDKYFVVTDSDMVRLKYLFVYKKDSAFTMKSWIYNNLTLVLIVLYVIILFCIGFFQGPTWARIQNRLYRMIYS
ncbi:hypothetical protein ILUMI_20380 [Ignelater luminosus]|uniref:Poly [ADP-ribose] polymerase n=1 Tax=Ignelater luminosus TaxID=2038154 RepID=A0A8K0CIB4_IGNLU|nr:hypothetical protein ILUMI_20380 [Ignelater luminosus]